MTPTPWWCICISSVLECRHEEIAEVEAGARERLVRLVERLELEHAYGFPELLQWWDEDVAGGR